METTESKRASKPFLVDIDLKGNRLVNACLEVLPEPPENPELGRVYYNSNTNSLMIWVNGKWKNI